MKIFRKQFNGFRYRGSVTRPKVSQEAEFKEFESRLKFKLRLKTGWVHLKLYSIFQDLSRRSIKTGFWGI